MPARTTFPTVTLRRKKGARGTRLYLDIYHAGERSRENLPILLTGDPVRDKEELRLAEQMRREVERKMRDGGLSAQRQTTPTLADALDAVTEGTSASAQGIAHAVKRVIAESIGTDLPPAKITESALRTVHHALRSKHSAATLVSYWGWLCRALRWLYREGYLSRDITLALPKPKSPKGSNRTCLTQAEVRTLLATPCRREDVRAAFTFGLMTGLRISELRQLEARHIQAGILRIRAQKTKQDLQLPLSDAAQAFITPHIEAHPVGKLFPLPCYSAVLRTVAAWGKAAGIERRVTPHVSRHTFITLAFLGGASLPAVSLYAGHASIATTQIYLHISQEQLKSAADAVPDFGQIVAAEKLPKPEGE